VKRLRSVIPNNKREHADYGVRSDDSGNARQTKRNEPNSRGRDSDTITGGDDQTREDECVFHVIFELGLE
jgi:hypothetical protein